MTHLAQTLLTPHPWFLALALFCSVGPALLFLANIRLYQPPPPAAPDLPRVSVLIPARDEEHAIAAAVESVLATTGLLLEVIVLDDASTDRTAEIVQQLAVRDPRVTLERSPMLPSGWNGKQHACHVLSTLARNNILCFLDADVRLTPDALPRLLTFMAQSHASLVSGFPQEETVTTLEWLLIPFIHFVLLCFLPFSRLRATPKDPSLAAGCGQILMVDRAAYDAAGGHAAIRETMHDGLRLPKLLRQQGFPTDLTDLTTVARCRMYTDALSVWRGLVKNATEGMAAPARIVPFTCLLLAGQVFPIYLLVRWPGPLTALAVIASYLPRFIAIQRFRQSWRGALLHPAGILVLLALQWYALACKLLGRRATWKERAYEVG